MSPHAPVAGKQRLRLGAALDQASRTSRVYQRWSCPWMYPTTDGVRTRRCARGFPAVIFSITVLGSQAVITGDVTQIDLPKDKVSGLKEVVNVLRDIDDIEICRLTGEDVVRHALVQKIIEAYEKYEKGHPRDAAVTQARRRR